MTCLLFSRSQPIFLLLKELPMFFGRFPKNPQWVQDMTGISDKEKQKIEETSFKTLQMEQLVLAVGPRLCIGLKNLLYENPDQDLNTLWWKLVEKYQMIKKPDGRNEPDWASKIHIATSPCYYHNYLLGELFASQLHY